MNWRLRTSTLIKNHPNAFLVILLMLFPAIHTAASTQTANRNVLEAAFIRHFGIYSKWPTNTFKNPSTAITICVVGSDPRNIARTLAGAALDPTFTVGSRKIIIEKLGKFNSKKLSSLTRKISNCQILFATNIRNKNWNLLYPFIKQLPVLTIGDKKGFSNLGGMIEIVLRPSLGAYKFKINLKNVRQQNLDLDSALLSLDIVEVVES